MPIEAAHIQWREREKKREISKPQRPYYKKYICRYQFLKISLFKKCASVCKTHHWCEWLQSSTDLKKKKSCEIAWFGEGSTLNFIWLESFNQCAWIRFGRWPIWWQQRKNLWSHKDSQTNAQISSIKTNCQKRAMDDLSVTQS